MSRTECAVIREAYMQLDDVGKISPKNIVRRLYTFGIPVSLRHVKSILMDTGLMQFSDTCRIRKG